jgi:nucleotide-binding universal stress UspA family protein
MNGAELRMSFSNIMVHLDLERTNDACLRIAVDLADRFNAKLIGIAAATAQSSHYEDETITQLPLRELYSDITKRLAQAEDRFRTKPSPRQIEWRSAIARPVHYVSREARAADLVIVGAQHNGLSDLAGSLDPGDLVMQVGRPVLVIPSQVEALQLKLAMICWKDTREARRAVSDALPLLGKVQEVVVAEVIEAESSRDAAHARLDDVIFWLKRHGVAASARVFHCPMGENPMEKLFHYGADVIVAGAYGHTRLHEWVFGGFTRDLIHRSPLCALLAH